MKYDIEKKVFTALCQKCSAKPIKEPLIKLELIPGAIFVPDILLCAECGAQLTIQTRDMTKEELKKREEKVRKVVDSAPIKAEAEFHNHVLLKENVVDENAG